MKRSWLSLGLICVAFGIISTNIYHETSENLTHSLKIFQESLPEGTSFHYEHANPNFLAQGLTLHHVTFQTKDTLFHAKTIRLGHPKILPNGRLSLSSLLIKEPDFQDSHLDMHMERLILRHVLIPSDGKLPLSTGIAAESIHSLATLTSFHAKELANIRFEWGYSEALKFHFRDSSKKSILIQQLNADNITAEGYGLGGHVRFKIINFHLNFQFNPTIFASSLNIPLTLNPLEHHTLSYQLSFNNFDGRVGITQLLNHPFRKNIEDTYNFWQDPLHTFWQDQGSLQFNGLSLSQKNHHEVSSFIIDSLRAERRKEGETLNTDALLTGFHLHLPEHPFTIMMNGKETKLRITEHSQEGQGEWHSQMTSLLTIPELGTVKTYSNISLPDEINEHIASQMTFHNTELTLQGIGLVQLISSFFMNLHSDQKHTTHNALFSLINDISNTRPLATPLADYLLKPDTRTLHINFGHISLETLQKIPFTGSPSAIFDSLHITNINTTSQSRVP